MSQLTDNEAIDLILEIVYNSDSFSYIPIEYIEEHSKSKLHTWDLQRLVAKSKELGLIRKKIDYGDVWIMASTGLEIMRKHGSYLAYLTYKEGKENEKSKNENFDRAIKNGNLIASVVVAGFAVYATLLSTDNNTERKRLKESIINVSSQIDSLRKDILKMQPPIQKKQDLDTATNK